MSAPESHRLPLACRITRWRAALGDASGSGLRGHCSNCAECRSYFEIANQLESTLRRGAAPARVLASGSLEARILNAVKHSHEAERQPPRRQPWQLAGVAVAAAIAVVVFYRIQDRPSASTPESGASIEDVLAVANDLPKRWLAAIQPNAVKLLEQNALQTEMALVSSDARSALDFLALNFMPSSPQSRHDSEALSSPRQSG